jgi:phosphoglucomutase
MEITLFIPHPRSFFILVHSAVAIYAQLMQTIFDFGLLKSLVSDPKFRFILDCMNGGNGSGRNTHEKMLTHINIICQHNNMKPLIDRLDQILAFCLFDWSHLFLVAQIVVGL